MATKNKKQSLADKINNLINVAPTNFNPDNDDETEETKAKVVDEFDEFESDDNDNNVVKNSSIRKKNVDLLDQIDDRYRGKKVNRKDIYGNDSSDGDDDVDEATEEEEEENDEQDDDASDDDEMSESDVEESDEESNDEDGEDESDEFDTDDDDEIDDENPLYRNRTNNKNFKNISVNNPRDEIEKGNCVREQLKIWENLLEMRIQLQKCLIASNKLPQFNIHKEYEKNTDFMNSKNQTKNKLMNLLENMLQVQNELLKNNPETKKLTDKCQNKNNNDDKSDENDPMDEEICSDTDDEMEKNNESIEENLSENVESDEPVKKKRKTLDEFEKILDENHKKYIPYRNSIIQTWNDRTRVASGNIDKGTTNQAVLKQIEFILNDKWKIIRKTQLKRSDYEIIGKPNKIDTNEIDNTTKNHEYDPEIYDDDDFYHQLLRELIQHKSADVTDPIQLSKQWAQLQNMRNKMKRKINTKESKGRRIRYAQIHNKLVNFMAPIEIDDVWSTVAKTELYNSLFGKFKTLDSNTIDKNILNNDTIILNK